VTDLVTQVTDDGAARFAQPPPQVVAGAVVDFGEVERDDAVEVTRDAAFAGKVDEVERQAVWRGRGAWLDRERQLVELVEQAPLGCLGDGPRFDCCWPVGIGPPSGQAARSAPTVAGCNRREPVASPCGVQASPHGVARPVDRVHHRIRGRSQDADRALVAEVGER